MSDFEPQVSSVIIKLLFYVSIVGSLGFLPEMAQAQLTPDNTLGAEQSQIFSSGIRDQIQGGAIRGSNLFHSFSEFNVGIGREVYFSNPAINNIIARVTGSKSSIILGRLGIDNTGSSPSLFLINPNGIIFGHDASLDISNSFTASTGSGVAFSDGSLFSAVPSENNNMLLSLSVPTGLQRPLNKVSSITNSGDLFARFGINLEAGQIVNDGKLSLDLATGGNIALTSYDGDMKVGGLISASTINLSSEKNIHVTGKLISSKYDINIISHDGSVNIPGSAVAKNINMKSNRDIVIDGILKSDRNGSIELNSHKGDIIIKGSMESPKINLESQNDILIAGTLNNFPNLQSVQEDNGFINLTSRLGDINFSGNAVGLSISLKSGKNANISGDLTTSAPFENDLYQIFGGGLIKVEAMGDLFFNHGRVDTSNTINGGGDIIFSAENFNSISSDFLMDGGPDYRSKGEFNLNVSDKVVMQNSNIRFIDERGGSASSSASMLTINADEILLDKSSVVLAPSSYIGNSKNPNSSSIGISAAKRITLMNESRIDGSSDYGAAGKVFISTPKLSLTDGSEIKSSFLIGIITKGGSGAISINSNNILLESGSSISADSSFFGKPEGVNFDDLIGTRDGSISIAGFKKESSDSLVISGINSRISAQVVDPSFTVVQNPLAAFGKEYLGEIIIGATPPVAIGGNIGINAETVALTDGASIRVGNNYSGDIYISDPGVGSLISPSLSPSKNLFQLCRCTALEKAGSIDIFSNKFSLSSGSSVIASATSGRGGSISINGNGTLFNISGNSVISAATITGEGGRVSLSGLNNLNLIQNSSILASAQDGKSGDITINSRDTVNLDSSKIFAVATGTANAGNLDITTELLTLNNKSQLAVSSQGSGAAGNLIIKAKSLNLDASQLIAETANGKGGNIEVNASNLMLMRRNNLISTTAGSSLTQGDGGNITIATPFLLGFARGNSDIVANAFTGRGGQIKINPEGTVNIISRNRAELAKALGSSDPTKLDPNLLSTNDVTAISQANPNLNGTVNFNAPNLDPGRGLAADPVAPANSQIVQDCRAQTQSSGNKFVNSRRGGTPPDPNGSVTSSMLWQDDRASPIPKVERNQPVTTTISEAQGWKRGPNNTVLFTTVNANRSANLSSTASRPCYAN
jgi:filamentous hemagglutinin family protein